MYEGQPYVVLSSQALRMQQRKPVFQTRMRNVLNGKIVEHNFMISDVLEEADIEKKDVKFLYAHRDEYWFADIKDPSKRFKISIETLGMAAKFLKANTEVEALYFNGNIVNIAPPIKMEFKVTEAPPAVRGNTVQGGVKQVTIETGATINVPLFINEGDIIRINTETGDYVERASK